MLALSLHVAFLMLSILLLNTFERADRTRIGLKPLLKVGSSALKAAVISDILFSIYWMIKIPDFSRFSSFNKISIKSLVLS